MGLTKFLPGAEKGEPDKFYPSGTRTFARVVPADDVQASAAAGWTRSLGARRVFLLGDKSLEGDGLVELYRTVAPEVGLRIVGADRMDPRADDYRDLAAEVAQYAPGRGLLRRRGGQQRSAALAGPRRGRCRRRC